MLHYILYLSYLKLFLKCRRFFSQSNSSNYIMQIYHWDRFLPINENWFNTNNAVYIFFLMPIVWTILHITSHQSKRPTSPRHLSSLWQMLWPAVEKGVGGNSHQSRNLAERPVVHGDHKCVSRPSLEWMWLRGPDIHAGKIPRVKNLSLLLSSYLVFW